MLQHLTSMFFSRDKEKSEEIPVEFLHKPKPQRKKKQYNEKLTRKESLHTTESIISEKVKKYLYKIFGGSRFTAILESPVTSSRSSSVYQKSKFTAEPTIKLSFAEKKYHTSKKQDKHKMAKMSTSFRKSLVQRKLHPNMDSMNNLYNANSNCSSTNDSDMRFPKKIKFLEERVEPASSEVSKNILKNLQSNTFCEVVDKLIKKQKKKQPRNSKPNRKKLKKTTKSSISTMCERAKLLLNDSYIEETQSTPDKEDYSLEDREEILTIQDLNNYDPFKISEDSIKIIRSKSLESLDIYAKCAKYNCSSKISSCTNLHHSSKLSHPFCYQDFEADLELWTTDYINGLVAVHEPKFEAPPISKIPVKKKCKSVKTKSKKCIKCDNKYPKDDVRLLTDFGRNSHLLGGVKTMEGKFAQKPEGQKTKSKKDDLYMCQKVQDIQNYIDNLMFPGDVTRHQKTQKYLKEISEPGLPKSAPKNSPTCPQKQSIQELKKFQRELKLRIKELEKKMPSTSSAFAKHGFLDVKKFPNDFCRRCNKKVFLVERICAGDGVYHNFCYTCYCCKRWLNSLNLCVTRGEVFCKQCFQKYFGIEMYGFVK